MRLAVLAAAATILAGHSVRGTPIKAVRTGDTTIFSRVLYQLSYLAAAG